MNRATIDVTELASAKPLVSVIVPVHNGERFLAPALRSILNQDYRPLELIVIDDGSTDQTAQIAASFSKARYFHQSNQGVATGRNAGLAAAQGELIAFLDADDLWEPNKLSLQVGYHLNHPDIDYSFVNLINFLEPGIEKPWWLRDDQLQHGQADYSPVTMLARSSVFQRVGLFDTSFKVGEDTDWFSRAKDAGIKAGFLANVCVRRRIHGGNLSYEKPSIRLHVLAKILKSSIDRKRKQSAAAGSSGEIQT
jgi:glycosyltransferase involved in cell wall biosynthesis